MKNDFSKVKKYIFSAISALGIAFMVGIIIAGGFLQRLENMTQDSFYQRQGRIPQEIKIIAIDEETLDRLGPYSEWDRSYFADLLNILNEDENKKPKVIGIDVVFSGTNDSDGDRELVEAAKKCDNLVLASALEIGSYIEESNGQYQSVPYVTDAGKPYESLDAVSESGFTNAIFDEDGVVRKTYTVITLQGENEEQRYDSFAYKIASEVGDVKQYPYQVEIAFTGKAGEFETFSMADVLDKKVPASYFKDCIVLIGAYEEGMMDAYRVPVDYSKEMYGVELQANYINAFLNDRIIYTVSFELQLFLTMILVAGYAFFAFNTRVRNGVIGMFVIIAGYFTTVVILFETLSYKMNLLYVPLGLVISFLLVLFYKYVAMQKQRVEEMQNMLFSMAEAMSEAIEGRTPYNANHTQNVAKRCVEMLDFINEKHRAGKTNLHFSNADKKQLYLAAMLHDVGKMDIPLEIMDKPTKLGAREKDLRARLQLISLHIENDELKGNIGKEEAQERQDKIKVFEDSLGAFNCGRPLKEDEWKLVDEIAESVYIKDDGSEITYLTQEEINDLHIKAGTLSEDERKIMQSHVIYTDKILAHMQFGNQFKDVRAIASNHHELLNGRGYPKGIQETEIDNLTRILTIMDIYDSLIADDRPYKKPKPIPIAFEILDEEAEAGKIDKDILEFAKELYLVKETKSEQ